MDGIGINSNGIRFENHSCDPNMEHIQEVFHHDTDVYFVKSFVNSITDIPADSDLTWDYKWKVTLDKSLTICNCGSEF